MWRNVILIAASISAVAGVGLFISHQLVEDEKRVGCPPELDRGAALYPFWEEAQKIMSEVPSPIAKGDVEESFQRNGGLSRKLLLALPTMPDAQLLSISAAIAPLLTLLVDAHGLAEKMDEQSRAVLSLQERLKETAARAQMEYNQNYSRRTGRMRELCVLRAISSLQIPPAPTSAAAFIQIDWDGSRQSLPEIYATYSKEISAGLQRIEHLQENPPGSTPGGTPGGTPGSTPGSTPGGTPGGTPGDGSSGESGGTPCGTPCGTPGGTPGGDSGGGSGASTYMYIGVGSLATVLLAGGIYAGLTLIRSTRRMRDGPAMLSTDGPNIPTM